MLWRCLLFSILLSIIAHAQDEDLSALETTMDEDPTAEASEIPKNRWSPERTNATPAEARELDLRSVIEEGFRRNALQQVRGQQKEQIELSKTDVFQRFWFPTISAQMQTNNHRVDRLHQSTQSTPTMGAQQAPNGSLGIVMDDYTIFNWGRDYLVYQNQKQVLNRADQQLVEARRRLKFSLITQ